MDILKYKDWSLIDEMTNDFINSFDKMLTEDKEPDYKSEQQRVTKKLKLSVIDSIIGDVKRDVGLISTFGAGIAGLYPIVKSLMSNISGQPIEITTESIVLTTIAAFSIIYLEEKKCKSTAEEDKLTIESKSLLEELRMRGIGDGIVKKVIKAIHSIKNIFSVIAKHVGTAIGGIIDMFSYTSLLIPIMNGVLAIIGKYNFDMDRMIENFFGLSIGIGTIAAKHGISYILDKIKNKFNIDKPKVLSQIETPVIQRYSDFTNPSDGTEIINEQ